MHTAWPLGDVLQIDLVLQHLEPTGDAKILNDFMP